MVVPIYLEIQDWTIVKNQLVKENLLQARTASSTVRLSREVVQRLAVLTDTELELLHDASPTERAHLMWMAACRRYSFIADFAEEVVRERFLLLKLELGHNDFDSFVRNKALWHQELNEIKNSTLLKLRSTLFRMLIEAGLLADGEIVPAPLSERVRGTLEDQRPSEIRFFPAHCSLENPN